MLEFYSEAEFLAHLFQVGLHQTDVPMLRDLDLTDQHEVVAANIAVEIDDVDVFASQILAETSDDARPVGSEGRDDESLARLVPASFFRIQGKSRHNVERAFRHACLAHLPGELIRLDPVGQADDHNEREIAAQNGLAASVDISGERFDGAGDGRHDAGMIARHHIQHIRMVQSTHAGILSKRASARNGGSQCRRNALPCPRLTPTAKNDKMLGLFRVPPRSPRNRTAMPLAKSDIVAQFQKRFDQSPQWVVRAPGRVNLIGEHTDYNDGFVMPMAIDRAAWIALRPRNDRRIAVFSVDYNQAAEFSLDELGENQKAGWIEYLKGTAWAMQESGLTLTGWEGVLQGDVPLGAGLSSSAALELATARAFASTSNLAWNPIAMAKLGQRAENKWVGVNCGIMDQLISAAGRANHALLIDCRSLETDPVPFPPGVAVAILDTSTRRGLVDSAYNERRQQCEAAAKFFGVKALRDVTVEQFEKLADSLDSVMRRRAKHVIDENARTLLAADAMRHGNAVEFGRLMAESHRSLRDDYGVSSDALNAMVESAAAHPACYGARMTGAGFGGCAMALIRAEAVYDFVTKTTAAYQQKTGHVPAVYICQAANGAEAV